MPKDEGIRPAYKAFLDSPGGQHFIQHLLTLEMTAQAEGRSAKTLEEKGLAMVKLNSAYDIRTHIVSMSEPASSQVARPGSK